MERMICSLFLEWHLIRIILNCIILIIPFIFEYFFPKLKPSDKRPSKTRLTPKERLKHNDASPLSDSKTNHMSKFSNIV